MRMHGRVLAAVLAIPAVLCVSGYTAGAEKSPRMTPDTDGYSAIFRLGLAEPIQIFSRTAPIVGGAPLRPAKAPAAPWTQERPAAAAVNAVTKAAAVLAPISETTASVPEYTPQGLASFELRSALQTSLSDAPGLRGALETALGRDADWGAALRDVKVADREVWRELLKFTPVVTASLQANSYSAANGSRPFDLTDRENYLAVSASLPIWTSGSRYYSIKAARSRRESLAYDAIAVRDQATLKLIETWTQTVAGQRDRELGLDAIKRLKRLRSAVDTRRKAGFASSSDVAQVDADIAAAARALSFIEGALAKSGEKLLRISGRKPDNAAKLARFDHYLRDGKQAFIQSAHHNNPQLQAAASRYRSEIYATRSAASRLLPSVNLTGEYRHYLDNKRSSSSDEGLTIGVRLQVPILDLSTVADTAAQSARREAALYREAANLNAVETEIDGLWSDRMATIAMRAEADREVGARKTSATAARDRFEKGFGSLEEAIRAETALLNSQRDALQLAAQESLIVAQLLIVSGRFEISMLGG